MRLSLPLPIALFAASLLHAQPAAPTRPTYPAPAYSVTVPFAVPADFTNLTTTLKLLAAANNGPANAFTIDTGSVGVVLPASEIPGFDPKAPGNTPGQLRYSSSGLTLDGFWTITTLRFLNPSSKQPMVESTLQVLAVTAGSCQGGGANSGRCTGNIPHMLGVGFGRGGDAANGMGSQARNPFVNLAAMQSSQPGAAPMRHGYLITPEGITFGLTDPETRNFTFVKLTPAITSGSASTPAASPSFTRDYTTAPGFLTLGTHDYPMGVILIDTGLTNMIVEEPNEPSSGDLPTGHPATVHLLGNQLRYAFTTGVSTTSVSPRRTTWARYAHGPFVNTGLRALACFNYLYDADNGYLALRPTCPAK